MAQRVAYNLRSILERVPSASGIYALHSQTGCVYVGEGEDICADLLVHLHDANPCLDLKDLIYLTFESVPPESRRARQTKLVMELHPSCLRREEYPECQGCSLAKKPLSLGGS